MLSHLTSSLCLKHVFTLEREKECLLKRLYIHGIGNKRLFNFKLSIQSGQKMFKIEANKQQMVRTIMELYEKWM